MFAKGAVVFVEMFVRIYEAVRLMIIFALLKVCKTRCTPLQKRIVILRENQGALTPELFSDFIDIEQSVPLEPYAEIVTTPRPPSVSSSTTPSLGKAMPVEVPKRLQYSDPVYNYTLLGICIPLGIGYLYISVSRLLR